MALCFNSFDSKNKEKNQKDPQNAEFERVPQWRMSYDNTYTPYGTIATISLKIMEDNKKYFFKQFFGRNLNALNGDFLKDLLQRTFAKKIGFLMNFS